MLTTDRIGGNIGSRRRVPASPVERTADIGIGGSMEQPLTLEYESLLG